MSVNEKMTAIADAIRDKTGGTEKLNLDDMAAGVGDVYNAGFEAGKQSEYDAFWDAFQGDYYAGPGKRLHYSYAFAYNGFRDINYYPKYPITPQNPNGISYLFTWSQYITDTKVPITALGNAAYAFNQAIRLKRIPKLIFSGTTNVSGMFDGCTALEELYCEGELTINGLNLSACTKLNKASIESVIGVLSPTTSGLSITLSRTAVDNAFGNGEEFSGTDGPEWGELIATKGNWTINLV